ncbi:LamG-like jellyroll fold domain-containing protein [Psychroserpens sp. XS_ASV72]|uniref:LamG-like jellyroll fold domain-containing protein n=1 Tax=Psychroserpens sp. XS_ASV72 TaxID=3241293 RepID=UPI00351863D1
MKKQYFTLRFLVALMLVTFNVSYSQSDIYESYVVLDINGSGNVYYDLNVDTANPNFEGVNLGTFNPSNSLVLNGAQNQTYKCGTHNILNSFIDYRIYLTGNTPPAFIPSEILFNTDDGTSNFCSGTSVDQTWESTGANIDILNGLPSGDYTLEVYTRSDADYDGDNILDNTYYISNGGFNYRATFRVDNPPTAVCTNFTAQLDSSGNVTISANDVDSGSSDDFGIASMGVTPNSFNCSNIGNNTVTLTVTDTDGQTNSCTATVTVVDSIDPTTPTLSTVTGECSATASVPTTTDNCSGTVTGTTSDPLTYNAQGTYTITWTFDDGNGNVITVPQTVIVDDVTDPATPTLSTVTGECSATASVPTTTDNCSGTITGTTSDPLTYNAQGTYTINWTFDDGNGNVITVPQTVIVDDVTDPAIPTLSTVTGECSATAIVPTTTDNCSGTVTGTTSDPLTYNAQGTYTITWSFDDGNGNVITVPQTVIVNDTTDPATPTLSTVTGECSATASVPTTTDNCSGTVTGTTSDPLTYNAQGTYTITWTFDDGNGNVISVPQTVIVDDVTDPSTPSLPILTGQCSVTVPIPTISDNCSGTISGTTSDPLVYNTQGAFAITWNFDDGNGNSISAVQNVVINDTVDPIPTCQDITIQLSDTTGIATITGSQIDNGSSDNCGVVNFSLSQDIFDCTDIGSNVIVLTVDDGNGNSAICTSVVTVVSPNISGGTALGYLNNTETIADQDNLIEVTACPDEPQNATINLTGHSGSVAYWETSLDGGLNWTTVANTTTTFYYPNILQTTLVRAVIQIGSCQAKSSIAQVVVIPPDVPPTIIGPDTFESCIGDDIVVTAESSFGINSGFNNGGMFNEANLNNLGWTVDGAAEMSAGGNNTNNTYWKLTNGPKKFNGKCFDSPDGNKFAVVSGIPPYVNPDHTITPLSTLETSVFSTLGLSTATLEFDQAYFLEAGAWLSIELSLDGGATYPITLDPGAGYNYTGPSDTGFVNGQSIGFGGQCRNNPGTLVDNHVVIDLQNYIGLSNMRIRFTYSGTANSVWALENITIPQAPVDEVIEWTDGTGVVVTTGSTTTISPVTPGVQTFGVTSLINGCRADGDEGTEFISVNASLAYAGEDIVQIIGECGEEVSLNAYDNDLTAAQNIANGVSNPALFTTGTYPGTQEAGVWSATVISGCGTNYSFSDISSPRSKFSAEPGTYELTWSIPTRGCSDTVLVTIESCPSVDFDGTDDYVTFDDNFTLSNQFSIEAWVKPNSITGTQTIFSKRNANDLSSGYDLRLVGSTVQFRWNNTGVIQSTYPISTNRWYHVAVTNSSGTYRLYIDGIEVSSPVSGSAPASNGMKALAGAMDQNGNPTTRPVYYFNGWIDELRIWNTALSTHQIRKMMNQEIIDNTAVRGAVVPLDVAGLNWTDLSGYYRMDITCGYLIPYAGSVRGQLRNMNSAQQQTAPLPYTSRVDGQNWSTDNTWTNFNVWDAPNSLGVDGSTPIDWNIVQVSHDISSGNKDITVLGLISDTTNKELTITDPFTAQDETNDGQMLRVTHYLKLDGIIDLVGESQLFQDEDSVLDVSSSGKLERDQQGTSNLYNYNYWSSPVSTINASANNIPFSIDDVLKDGTNSANPLNLQWIMGQNANGSTMPITQTSRWLYTYENYPEDSYASWNAINETSNISTGLGFTMKGSGAGDPIADYQNYVFVGKPNNGNITTPVTVGNQALVGNPYPSAIDANLFILDNIPGGNSGTTQSIDGTLYFWEHYTSNFTHILEEYEGGYATYNLTGGNAAVSPPLVSGNGTPTKLPSRYVPVSQGFFVTASNTGGSIQFKNSQRGFVRESLGNSVFIRSSSANYDDAQTDSDSEIKRVRLDFKTSEGAIRPLLLGFVSNGFATDAIDYGYDAENTDSEFSNDAFWNIENRDFTTQGVGSFAVDKQYPLSMYISDAGTYEISLKALENFDEDVEVFIYDVVTGNYFNINTEAFQITLDANTYVDRFFVTFQSEDTLSTVASQESQTIINYLNATSEIYVKTFNTSEINQIRLVNILGQEIQSWNNTLDYVVGSAIRIPVQNMSTGTYIIEVHTDRTILNTKVIIK